MMKTFLQILTLILLWSCVSEHVEPNKPTGPSGSGFPYVPAGIFAIENLLIGDRPAPESIMLCAIDDRFTVERNKDGKYFLHIDLGMRNCGHPPSIEFLLNESSGPDGGFNFALPPGYRITRFSYSKNSSKNYYEVNGDGSEIILTIAPKDYLSSPFKYKLQRIL